jgi:hypothetical protein
MYVLVRNDLAETYRIVQGAHALAQFAIEYSTLFNEWHNSTIVFLGTRNLLELKQYMTRLESSNKIFSRFYEPDLENQLTAIACYDSGEVFSTLKVAI